MPPHLLRYDCLHTPPPLSSPLANPNRPLQPRAQPPQPTNTTSSPHYRRLQAPAHGASCLRCTQRTDEVQRRQLRHPSETRCQQRCPIISNLIGCTQQRPTARRLKPPPPARAPHATASARNTPNSPCTAGGRKHPLTAQLPPMHTSAPPRSSAVSCVILPRLGASDAAPASPI
jgi:hypothetical protein